MTNPRIPRRVFLGAAVAGLATACAPPPAPRPAPPAARPNALVHRGSGAPQGTAEAVAELLSAPPLNYRVAFTGTGEDVPLDAESLSGAVLYAYPGGGDVGPAWWRLRRSAGAIRDFVRGGGCYLGFCLGAYLAGSSPGLGLLPGDTDRYAGSPGSEISHTAGAVVDVDWRQRGRQVYFQDGPYFRLEAAAPVSVLAHYRSGQPAAVVGSHGRGSFGLVGPHPEATDSWYTDDELPVPAPTRDLAVDLVNTALAGRGQGA
ncbi:BPL-N domain-containing protein [Saccharopolyspora rosea]|uniref:BPL-N domain-containing protein n=1 Tax=Saccharopolyspora rosea TaxID=524884 RepID=A0ABW3FUN9_9PSEU|nr:BPL-N domain-containing protein [Saccharopolyspora rosea]